VSVPLRWYLLALLGPLGIFALAFVFAGWIGWFSLPVEDIGKIGLLLLPSFVSIFFFGGGQEELGWRGFALPRLLRQGKAGSMSLWLGVVWACWRLPLYLIPGTSQYTLMAGTPFGVWVPVVSSVAIVGQAFLLTWLFTHTRHSVLLAMLFHASLNAGKSLPRLAGASALVGFQVRILFFAACWLWALMLIVECRLTPHEDVARQRLIPDGVAD
jgi:uncharacterized protein